MVELSMVLAWFVAVGIDVVCTVILIRKINALKRMVVQWFKRHE